MLIDCFVFILIISSKATQNSGKGVFISITKYKDFLLKITKYSEG